MGGATSTPEDSQGYQVLGVEPGGPASEAGLVPFFDFIVAGNGVEFVENSGMFSRLLTGNELSSLRLTVFNTKMTALRDVIVVPARDWGGKGLLGAKIRFGAYADARDNVVRVTEVFANGPAAHAGLESGVDYLLGTVKRVFATVEDLSEEISDCARVVLFVYSAHTDSVRQVVLEPSLSWGGEGALGATVARGLLHRLPDACCETPGMGAEEEIDADTSFVGIAASPARERADEGAASPRSGGSPLTVSLHVPPAAAERSPTPPPRTARSAAPAAPPALPERQ